MEEAQRIFKDTYKGSEESLQASLYALKRAGYTQIEVVKLLIGELQLSLREADTIVLNSTAWQEAKQNTLRLRDNFGEALSEE